jgi:DNA modification methylase
MNRTTPRNLILQGDAVEQLGDLADASIDCVVTSPPYFRLRNYQVTGQLGLEPHVDDWVRELRAVLHEVARVLVPTGTVWLNLGDSFSTHPREGARRKSLLMAPERLALALMDDGWTIRNKVVWHKTNTVPTSVTDRLATKHEVIYLLTRSTNYYFDLNAIRQPHVTRPRKSESRRPPTRTDQRRPAHLGPNSDGDAGLAALHRAGLPGHPLGKNPGDVWSLSVSGYRGAHFATFPQHLVERILLAGCPERRCTVCRQPWHRPLERRGTTARRLALTPTCNCNAPSEPGLVLDPFIGSGTTGLVAKRLGRDWLGVELNPTFIGMAGERLTGTGP